MHFFGTSLRYDSVENFIELGFKTFTILLVKADKTLEPVLHDLLRFLIIKSSDAVWWPE